MSSITRAGSSPCPQFQSIMVHELSEIRVDDNAAFTSIDIDTEDGVKTFADERMWDYISDEDDNVLPKYRVFDEQVYFYTSLDNLYNMSITELLLLVD